MLISPAADGLANPPVGIGGEPIPAGWIKALSGSDEAHVGGLDQILLPVRLGQPEAALGHIRNRQPQVGLHEPITGPHPAAPDAWRARRRVLLPPLDDRAQLDLLSRGEQGNPADRVEPPGLGAG
jgi:hypothetical protein